MKRSSQHAFEPQEVMAYLDGELEPRQAAALGNHLEHCAECRAVAAQLRQVSEHMLEFRAEPCPANIEEPIFATLNSREGSRSAKSNARILSKRQEVLAWFAWAGVAVAVLIGIAALVTRVMRFTETQVTLPAESVDEAYVTRSRGGEPRVEVIPRQQLALPRPALPLAPQGIIGGVPGGDGRGSIGKLQLQKEAPELRGPMIVQTASITMLASNYDQASAAIEPITKRHGGYVQDMNVDTRTGMARTVSATLRVPDSQLDVFLADLRKLSHVEQETRNNQEVTDQYVDLTARLKTARATEQRILELLAERTGKLSDVLDAERELARIRGDVESMDGQRANLVHRVRYASVQLQLNEEYRAQLNPKAVSAATLLRNSLVDGFRNLADGAVSLLIFLFAYGPSILFWAGLIGIMAWFVWRRFRL